MTAICLAVTAGETFSVQVGLGGKSGDNGALFLGQPLAQYLAAAAAGTAGGNSLVTRTLDSATWTAAGGSGGGLASATNGGTGGSSSRAGGGGGGAVSPGSAGGAGGAAPNPGLVGCNQVAGSCTIGTGNQQPGRNAYSGGNGGLSIFPQGIGLQGSNFGSVITGGGGGGGGLQATAVGKTGFAATDYTIHFAFPAAGLTQGTGAGGGGGSGVVAAGNPIIIHEIDAFPQDGSPGLVVFTPR